MYIYNYSNIFLLDFASNAIFIAKYILYEVLQLMVILYLCGTLLVNHHDHML